ncbi:MAG: purine-nucleoside phosphorylase [Flavobacteriales bacterium]|nr:purine-nucleoside phosphorylase [Flavobacteriales bacterium]
MWPSFDEAVAYIQSKTKIHPVTGIILGSGLGGLVHELHVDVSIPYAEIPNFPISTVEGHKGRLILGYLNDIPVVVMQGRFHYYEGYTMQQVCFPVRVMKLLGAEKLLVSNAAGGMNPNFQVGDLMLIRDHINLFPENPLRGTNDSTWGPRFPDMSHAYNKQFIEHAENIAHSLSIAIHKGVYAGVPGPCFETPAEYKYLRIIGADAVGMSTVPEIITAVHAGMQCFGISVITDLGLEGEVHRVTHEEVMKAAHQAEKKMTALFKELIKKINN